MKRCSLQIIGGHSFFETVGMTLNNGGSPLPGDWSRQTKVDSEPPQAECLKRKCRISGVQTGKKLVGTFFPTIGISDTRTGIGYAAGTRKYQLIE